MQTEPAPLPDWILPPSERLESPHQSRRVPGLPVDVLVIHYAVDGDQSPDGPDDPSVSFEPRERSHDCMDVARAFARPARKASAHLVLGRDGSKVQCVPLSRTAHHAGGGALPLEGVGPLEPAVPWRMNRRSIGVECCNAGWAVDALGIPEDERITAGHPATPRRRQQWEVYAPPLLETLEYTTALLVQAVPTLRFYTGHEDVVNHATRGKPGGKTDPGPAFPPGLLEKFGLRRIRFDFRARAWVLD